MALKAVSFRGASRAQFFITFFQPLFSTHKAHVFAPKGKGSEFRQSPVGMNTPWEPLSTKHLLWLIMKNVMKSRRACLTFFFRNDSPVEFLSAILSDYCGSGYQKIWLKALKGSQNRSSEEQIKSLQQQRHWWWWSHFSSACSPCFCSAFHSFLPFSCTDYSQAKNITSCGRLCRGFPTNPLLSSPQHQSSLTN